ncbi:hypothetical protein BTA37_27690 [Priestia megaterium]|uniref:ROK family transcriptional regulator n=1 Tax=Priestia megaterium TaxID=1404 RepID=UPI00094DAEDA|nr:ROK family transcriptional regulator [Priestia megaterium]OLO26582.1 hypothetical protein BTA37_27690 [Priestia megaterium]
MLKGQNTTRTKQLNQSLVLKLLLQNGPMSRQQISEITDLTPATITYISAELIEQGLVMEKGDLQNTKPRAGRKSVALDLNGDSYWVLGINTSMEKLKMGLVNLKGMITDVQSIPVPSKFNTEEFLSFLAKQIKMYLQAHPEVKVSGVGIGALGAVDLEKGKLLGNDRLGWPDVDLISYLQKEITVPIFLDNNVSAMTLAEKMFGNSKQFTDFMCIYLGHRIGAGLVLKNELYRNGRTGAGEFGHMTYMPEGRTCWCGNKGCLNQYASEEAILNELQATNVDEVLQRAVDGEVQTINTLEKAAECISIVLSSFINMVNLKKVVLCGTLSSFLLPVADIIRKEVNQRPYLARIDHIEIESSKLGDNIEVIGAGGLALWYGLYQKSQC